MPNTDNQIEHFLAKAGWTDARRTPLAGDASARRYDRLTHTNGGDRAVLMDSRRDAAQVGRFQEMAVHLRKHGLSAPEVLATDANAGLALVEDLGDGLLARVLETEPDRETPLYLAAVRSLIALQATPPPEIAALFATPDHLATAAAALRWYPGLEGEAETRLLDALAAVLTPTDATDRVLCLRDYHAENLIWLPDRAPPADIGLLDFQDAVAGHPAYDLISLLGDARRDVTAATREAALSLYLDVTGREETRFRAEAAALGAQRNLRILTQFARLALRDGKPGYLALMPRVWANLQSDLSHPALSDLRRVVASLVRPPTPDLIAEIEQQCRAAIAP